MKPLEPLVDDLDHVLPVLVHRLALDATKGCVDVDDVGEFELGAAECPSLHSQLSSPGVQAGWAAELGSGCLIGQLVTSEGGPHTRWMLQMLSPPKTKQSSTPKPKGPKPSEVAQYHYAWVEAHSKASKEYISESLAEHTVVGIGELHHDTTTRNLVADWIQSHGSPNTALAVEVSSSDQAKLDQFVSEEGSAHGWWRGMSGFQNMLQAANAKGMPILAADASASAMRRAEGATSTLEGAERFRDPQRPRINSPST